MNLNRYERVIEINGDDKISLPIVKFPPFKLRAAMVEKDPVIWLHLLETYNQYFTYLMSEGHLEQLEDSTYENLCMFIKSYLRELSDEEGKLLSLGMNTNVCEQLQVLRSWVLTVIKTCGLLHLQISCDVLWDFVRLYVKENPGTVRLLVDGSLKPAINTQKAQINRIYQLHQHLKQLIESSKFTRVDLKALENLLSAGDKHTKPFTNQFLTAKWADILESWFSSDLKPLRDISKKIGVLSYLTASEDRIVELIPELNVFDLESLHFHPFLGSLLISEQFQIHFSGIKAKLPFLRPLFAKNANKSHSLRAEDVQTILEVFPHLTVGQIERRLQAYDCDVERTINSFFESPTEADKAPLVDEVTRNKHEEMKDINFESELRKADRLPKSDEVSNRDHVPDEIRNKTLTRALALLYQADEDEKDDTYDDAEVQRDALGNLDSEDRQSANGNANDNIEAHLWQLLKVNKELFDRSSRSSKARKELKSKTSWSDEQIEGWARMLERSPKRAQILEEKYMFRGNIRTGKRAFVQNKNEGVAAQNKTERNDNAREVRSSSTAPKAAHQNGTADKKKQNARKEKHKSARANHNRKSGHDKKISRVLP
ncbi:LAQU0S02e10572g1_1 [Lachancea quebecensis]|uniref:LAQU0S02e10572g1_1 n=1 Tax=Lachancea quebecensis TaxID=1654605 RepID=A0A0P1KR39_9SACH|nr:LAQU0S02e10572g1_1 [Lachancea quebecensis]